MNLDLGSFAFGTYLEQGTGTPSWGTSLGQSQPAYKFTYPGSEVVLIGMVYCSVPLNCVSLPLGKGGRVYQASELEECQIASLFRKVYINGVRIDYPFIMVLVKEKSESHSGRKSIKYSDKNSYNCDGEQYSNAEFIRRARKVLGLKDEACWFIHSIEVYEQDELHMSAVVVDKESSVYYYNSSERRNSWLELIDSDENKESFIEGKKNEIEISIPLQQIFYGAPGTGKSNTIKREVDEKGLPNVRTTFHPDSDYSTFVGAYKPTSIEVPVMTNVGTKAIPTENPDGTPRTEKKIVYEFVPQAFLKAYTEAWKNQDQPFFLIIEEINRGNCAQIFGDLFQLLDRNDDGESDYPITPDEDIQKFLLEDKTFGFASLTAEQEASIPEGIRKGRLLKLPKNLHIWATMNTSDQSLFPIDSAFKRRWDWQYMPIADGHEGWQIEAGGNRYDWWEFVQKVNEKIAKATHSEDKKLGYFFCKPKGSVIDAATFVGKVVFYIWNDVFKDFAEDGDTLFKAEDGTLLSFDKFYTITGDCQTRVVESNVVQLLKKLGVEPVTVSDEAEEDGEEDFTEEEIDDNSTNQSVNSGARKFDYTKYSVNGQGSYPKGRVAQKAISLYVSMHPEMSDSEVVSKWLSLNVNIPNLVETRQMFETRTANSSDSGLKARYKTVQMQNGQVLYVSNQYTPARVQELMEKVNSQDWGIRIEEIDA